MTSKNRESNIELLRVVAMLMIVAYHIFSHCVQFQMASADSMARLNNNLFDRPIFYRKLLLLVTLTPFGKIGDVIFITISGYFMADKSKINISKTAVKLLTRLGFAALSLTIVSTITYAVIRGKYYIDLIDFSYFSNINWFIGYYFAIIVFAALFLNEFLKKLGREQYVMLLLILFASTQFVWCSSFLSSLADGLLIFVTGVFLYALGGYLKIYNPLEKVKTIWLVLAIAAAFGIIYLSYYNNVMTRVTWYKVNNGTGPFTQTFPSYTDNGFLPIVIGVMMFEVFRRIKIKNSSFINYLGGATLMVYLFHDNEFVHTIWNTQDWITILFYRTDLYVLKHAAFVLATFAAGVLLYALYDLTMKFIVKNKHILMKKSDK